MDVVKPTIRFHENNTKCKKCGSYFKFNNNDAYFDEHGFGYSTKLVKCPECGSINVLYTLEDFGISKLNSDERLYQ